MISLLLSFLMSLLSSSELLEDEDDEELEDEEEDLDRDLCLVSWLEDTPPPITSGSFR